MELLEEREAELRRCVVGATAVPRSSGFTGQSIVDRVRRVNAQLEQLNATISGFSRLAELYHANHELLQLHRSGAPPPGSDEPQRAVILSSEDHIASVVGEFQKLQELQRYVAQLYELHASSEYARGSIDRLETTHAVQEERALLIHARVEKILSVYQEMISCFLTVDCGDGCIATLDHGLLDGIACCVYVQVLSEKCVEYSAALDQLTQ